MCLSISVYLPKRYKHFNNFVIMRTFTNMNWIQNKQFFFICVASAQNECSNTVYKELGNLAKRSPTYFQDAVPLCDRYLLKGWYFAFYNKMPTTAPGLGYCGTTYPYWLDGD